MAEYYSAEELLLDESFVDYCLHTNSAHKAKWEQVLASHPLQQKAATEAREMLSLLAPQLGKEEITVEVNKLREILNTRADKQSTLPDDADALLVPAIEPRRNKLKRVALYGLAAVSISLLGLRIFSNNPPVTKPAPQATIAYSTGTGERRELILPDGTIMILKSNSSVSLSPDFGEKERNLTLSGEAFFKVAKDVSKPFIVHSNRFSTTAIGTAFYVDGRNAEAYKVTLLEGKVKLNSALDAPAFLDAGEEANWSAADKSFNKTHFDTSYLQQWVNGRLSFDKTPLPEAINRLQHWYGVTIADERKAGKTMAVTGDYINQPLEDVLKVICFSLSCKYVLSDEKIIIQ